MAEKRIAILVYCYPVAYSPTILNTALYWARQDYKVDLLIDRYVFDEIEQQHPLIKIMYCTKLPPVKKSASDKTETEKSSPDKQVSGKPKSGINLSVYRDLYKSIFPQWLLQVRSYSRGIRTATVGKSYCFAIAFEPEALIAAGWSGLTAKYKSYYHSLELYENNTFKNRLRRKLERKALKKTVFTVVQDEYRKEKLILDLGRTDLNVILSPVSMMGPALADKSDYVYRKFNIPKEKKIILYTGAFYSEAMIEEMANSTNDPLWDKDWVLLLHGFCNSEFILNNIRKNTRPEKIMLSLSNLSQNELDLLTSSAHIGLALYSQRNANLMFTILSSGKIAQYAKCGLPVVLISNPPTDEFIGKYRCGVALNNESEICQGISLILKDYERYRNNMLEAFRLKYDFETNYKPVADYLLN